MGARFCACTNSGVTALISVNHYKEFIEPESWYDYDVPDRVPVWEEAIAKGLRIFTFCSARRLMRNPREMRYFTGVLEDVPALLGLQGPENAGVLPKSFLVPFSRGLSKMRNEHIFSVSHADIIEWFGSDAETAIL